MTPEEKLRRNKQREIEREERARKFPEAFYCNNGMQLMFDEGEDQFLIIRTNDLGRFRPSTIGGDAGWLEVAVSVDDVFAMSEFAAALMCRLNYLIDETNLNLRLTKARKLRPPAPTAEE